MFSPLVKIFDYQRAHTVRSLWLSIVFVLTVSMVSAQSFTLLSWNIRYDNPDDGPDNWNVRKQELVTFLSEQDPWLFGIQEGLNHQVTFIDTSLPNYRYIGVGRDDGNKKGEFCAIYYQSEHLELMDSGTFWLSETPVKVSVSWDAALERICTFGLFSSNHGNKKFWVFNTHFDHRGTLAREKSAELILEKIKQINTGGYPVVLMGDFNATPQESPIELITEKMTDSREISQQAGWGPAGTFNGFRGETEERRIDYIFTEGFKVKSYDHLDPRTNMKRNLSDHLPVMCTVSFK